MAEIYTPQSNDAQSIPEGAEDGWLTKRTNDDGPEYRVKPSADPNGEIDSQSFSTGVAASPPGYSVDWRAHTSGLTDDTIKSGTSITWYKVDKAPWYSPYTWRLTFRCNSKHTFHFHDATNSSGGTYECQVIITNSDHSVDYDSSSPDIVKVDVQ